MIRLKNSILPVWFQWDGDEASLEKAKQSIIDDIVSSGLSHYTGYADIVEDVHEQDANWDGTTPQIDEDGAPVEKRKRKDKVLKDTAASKQKQKENSAAFELFDKERQDNPRMMKSKNSGLPSGTPNKDKFVESDGKKTTKTTQKTAS